MKLVLTDQEELEIVDKYVRGEITATQAAEQMNVGYPGVYRHLSTRMMRACRQGTAKFELITKK